MSEEEEEIKVAYRPGKRTLGELIKAGVRPISIVAIAQNAIGIDTRHLEWQDMMNTANLALLDEKDYITLKSNVRECFDKYSGAILDGGFL